AHRLEAELGPRRALEVRRGHALDELVVVLGRRAPEREAGHARTILRLVRPTVHVTGPVPERVQRALAEAFTLADGVEGVDGILSLITATVDGDLLDRAGSQLRIVANYGVGVDNVDLAGARERGVLVANTPDVLTHATAELAIALTLALLRRVAEGDRFLRRRARWSFSLEFMLGESMRGKTFGVVGPGRIGRATAALAEAL